MIPPVDHLVYAAPDLDAAVEDLDRKLGVRAAFGGKHPGRGTHNALLALGGRSYLEIIAPDPEQPPPKDGRFFGIETLREPRLVTWAMRVVGIEEKAAAARTAGYDPGPVLPLSRALPDGETLTWRLTFRTPLPGDGLVPFLIEWDPGPHPSASPPGGCRLAELEAEHPHPPRVEEMLAALGIDLRVTEAGRPALIATIEGPAGIVVLT